MRLTIAIPTFAREEVLVATLEQVVCLRDAARMEVLVVDQTPEHAPRTAERLAGWEKDGAIRLVRVARPSLPGARNVAYREARGDIILFLDDDVIIPPHLFEKHLAAYDDASISAVTGQVFNCLDPARPPPLDRPEEGTRPHSLVREPCMARNISGGNHSVRRDAALAVRGFDENFRGAALAEDLDFAQRFLDAGFRISYQPDAWIIHLGVKSGGCGITGSRTWPEWTHSAGLWLYGFRHGWKLRNWGWVLWMALRNGPLRKEVVKRPGRWPAAWWGWLRGMAYGLSNRRIVRNSQIDAAGAA